MKLIIEPQCTGFEHAQVNTAFLDLFKQSFPEEKILFLGDSDYIKNIEKKDEKVEYISIKIPNRHLRGYSRLLKEWSMLKKIYKNAIANEIREIFFLSITGEGLLALKIFSFFVSSDYKFFVIPHSNLASIGRRYPIKRIWELPLSFKYSFNHFNNKKIKFILLGDFIKNNVLKLQPNMAKYTDSLHLPYTYKCENIKEKNKLNETIKFGFVGLGHKNKGADIFFELANYIKNEKRINADFYIIGNIDKENLKNDINDSVYTFGENQIIQEEFERMIEKMDYTIYLYGKDNYRFIASGAILDSFSYLKPVICLRNEMFEYYFSKGDIGYLCNDFNEIKRTVEMITEKRDNEKYFSFKKNIYNLRQELSVKALSKILIKIYQN